MAHRILVATNDRVYTVDPTSGEMSEAHGISADRPACLAAPPLGTADAEGFAWCGTEDGGLFRSDGGRSWTAAGLAGEHVTAVAVSPADPGLVWAGTEPSAVWRCAESDETDGEAVDWERREGLDELPSSSEWSFPPRPHTHHVRWIACHPTVPDRLWVAIEAGALIRTMDGGRTWRDRVPGGPYDTHELAIHPARPDVLRVSAGDGYYESGDGGDTWSSPMEGLEVGYLRSVAVDPGDPSVVLVSAASAARRAYAAGRADGRLYRREGTGRWERITAGWPTEPSTIAPLLAADPVAGTLLAADERGVHRSTDGGRSWERIAVYPARPDWLRGLVPTPTRAASS